MRVVFSIFATYLLSLWWIAFAAAVAFSTALFLTTRWLGGVDGKTIAWVVERSEEGWSLPKIKAHLALV